MHLQYRISPKGPVVLLCYDRIGGDDQQPVDNAWFATERSLRAFRTADPDDYEAWPMDWTDAKELGSAGEWGRLVATKRRRAEVQVIAPQEFSAAYA